MPGCQEQLTSYTKMCNVYVTLQVKSSEYSNWESFGIMTTSEIQLELHLRSWAEA